MSTSERSTNEAVIGAKNMKGAAVVLEERREPREVKKRRTGGIVSGAFVGENVILSEGSSNTAAVVGTVTGKKEEREARRSSRWDEHDFYERAQSSSDPRLVPLHEFLVQGRDICAKYEKEQ